MNAVDLIGDLFADYTPARREAPKTSPATRARDIGMRRALDHAETVTPKWADQAYAYLKAFAAKRREPFISEVVSNQSKLDHFPQPPTDRAWGAVYRKAAKDGLIVRDGTGISLRRHASICPRWRSLVAGA